MRWRYGFEISELLTVENSIAVVTRITQAIGVPRRIVPHEHMESYVLEIVFCGGIVLLRHTWRERNACFAI